MLSAKSDVFLKEVLSYVRFSFDRGSIRTELENHLSDKMEFYMEQDYDMEEAEQRSIYDMGNAKEIGEELNRQHNPIIGWIWRITNVITALIITGVAVLFVVLVSSYFRGNAIDKIPKANIVYQVDINKKVKIDDKVIRFTKLIYEKDGDMNICYKYYNARLGNFWWNGGYLGEVSDNLGNKYTSQSGQENSGIITKGVWTIQDFSDKAKLLIISYDRYNRKFMLQIPLKEGENDE